MDEYCPGVGRRCSPPEKCCLSGTRCCLPEGNYRDRGPFVQQSVRFSFVDLWYFWFAVVFLITACTGVCAYWRRQRRLLLLNRRSSSIDHHVHSTLVEAQRQLVNHDFDEPMPGLFSMQDHQVTTLTVNGTSGRLSYFATILSTERRGTGGESATPALPLGGFPDPPPYAEVAAGGKQHTNPSQSDLPSYADVSSNVEHAGWSQMTSVPSLPTYSTTVLSNELPVYCDNTASVHSNSQH